MDTASNSTNSQVSSSEFDMQKNMELWKNLQEASAIWMEISKEMQAGSKDDDIPLDPLNINETMANVWMNFWNDPVKAMQKQADLITGTQEIWQQFMTGSDDGPIGRDEGGRRFAHKKWKEDMVYAFMRSNYLFFQRWVDQLVEDVDNVNSHDRIVAGLSLRNLVDMMNPANFALTNPEVIETTINENGANLVRGFQMMLEDVKRGKGQLLIRQVDMDAFELGRNVAVTPGKVIFENPHFQIIQYAASTKEVHSTPVLIVPPWINKYYILDLNEKKSYAKWVVDQGYTAFMISWLNADHTAKDFTWESRIEAISEAIDVVNRECGVDHTHMVSFCIGGTLVGSMLAEQGATGDKRVKSTTFLTAQFDFENAGELKAFVSKKSVGLLDQFDEQGFIPAESMSSTFNLLRSSDLIWSYIVNNYMLGKTPKAFDLLYWNSDSMRMPTQVQKYYLDQFYLRNAFMKDELPFGDHHVGVGTITTPTYHMAAIDDHIAPANSVYFAAKAMKNANVRYVLSGSGHIAGVVNPPSMEKYQYWSLDDLTADTMEDWLSQAKETPGSWWLDWIEWLGQFEDEMVNAREPGEVSGVIEDAPGRYVAVRFDE